MCIVNYKDVFLSIFAKNNQLMIRIPIILQASIVDQASNDELSTPRFNLLQIPLLTRLIRVILQ